MFLEYLGFSGLMDGFPFPGDPSLYRCDTYRIAFGNCRLGCPESLGSDCLPCSRGFLISVRNKYSSIMGSALRTSAEDTAELPDSNSFRSSTRSKSPQSSKKK